MAEDYQNIETRKATAQIEKGLYDRVTKNFHQGQVTALFRNVFESLDVMIAEGKFIDITNYIYKAKSLTLKPIKEPIKHATNGSNKSS